MTKAQQQLAHNRAKRMAEYEQAQALCQQGWTITAISAHLGRHHRTVKKYLGASTFPKRPPRRHPLSILEPYQASLRKRWPAGYRSAKELSWQRISAACDLRRAGLPDGERPEHRRRQWRSISR
jgi:hypothetical protein